MGEDLEAHEKVDRYEKMQPKKRPVINESFVGADIEQLWEYTEKKKGKKEKKGASVVSRRGCRCEGEQQGAHPVGK